MEAYVGVCKLAHTLTLQGGVRVRAGATGGLAAARSEGRRHTHRVVHEAAGRDGYRAALGEDAAASAQLRQPRQKRGSVCVCFSDELVCQVGLGWRSARLGRGEGTRRGEDTHPGVVHEATVADAYRAEI